MMRTFLLLTGIVCQLCSLSAAAQTNYFVVGEFPGREHYFDSYVLPLSDSSDIAHARALIASHGMISGALVVAGIAPGADGINRNYMASNCPPWSWHVTEFGGFGDYTIEVLDGSPTYVETHLDWWINNTGGAVGFWNYTIVAELPVAPQIANVSVSTNQLEFTIERLCPPFIADIEQAGSLTSGVWNVSDSFAITNTVHEWSVPTNPDEVQHFYRINVHQ